LADTLDTALVTRLREVLARGSATESDLRGLTEQADGWVRILRAQLRTSERRLRTLSADPTSPIAELADELRRIESLRPQLRELRALHRLLEKRAREMRTRWLLEQAGSPGSAGGTTSVPRV
jgi:hypothetical protein